MIRAAAAAALALGGCILPSAAPSAHLPAELLRADTGEAEVDLDRGRDLGPAALQGSEVAPTAGVRAVTRIGFTDAVGLVGEVRGEILVVVPAVTGASLGVRYTAVRSGRFALAVEPQAAFFGFLSGGGFNNPPRLCGAPECRTPFAGPGVELPVLVSWRAADGVWLTADAAARGYLFDVRGLGELPLWGASATAGAYLRPTGSGLGVGLQLSAEWAASVLGAKWIFEPSLGFSWTFE